MKRVIVIIAMLMILAMPASAEVIAFNDVQTQESAEPVLENILLGFKNNDYLTYAADFDVTLKEAISEDKFYQTDKWYDANLGPLVSKQYL